MEIKEFELMVKGKWYNAVNVCIGSDERTLVDYNGTLVELDSFDKESGLGCISIPETKEVWID